jgi:hypothetical protein
VPPYKAERVEHAAYATLVACAYFGFPVVAMVPVILGLPSLAISVAYRGGIVAGSVAYLWYGLRNGRPTLAAPVQWALGILVTILFARLTWDYCCVPLPLDLPWDRLWAQAFIFALLPSLPFLLIPDLEALKLARRVCNWAAVAAVVAVGVAAYYSVRQPSAAGRLATDVINPITIGEVGVSLFILALSYSSGARVAVGAWWRSLGRALGAFLGIVTCVASASKGPLLSLVVVAAVMFVYRLTRLSTPRKLLEFSGALLLLCSLLVLAIVLAQHGLLAVYDRISDIASDQSTALRVQAWQGALAQFDSSPLWGSPVVELSTRFYPHNAVFETMMATGVAGLLPLLVLQAWGATAAHHVMIKSPENSWIALLFLQHAIGAMLSGSIYVGTAIGITLLMLLGVYQAVETTLRDPLPPLGTSISA